MVDGTLLIFSGRKRGEIGHNVHLATSFVTSVHFPTATELTRHCGVGHVVFDLHTAIKAFSIILGIERVHQRIQLSLDGLVD